MKYALIADIHANLEALEVVLEDAKNNNCTHYVCLGDVVGYNPNPKECMKIVRDMGCLLYTSPSPRDATLSRMPSSA